MKPQKASSLFKCPYDKFSSQQRREQSDDTFPEALEERRVQQVAHFFYRKAVGLVVEKYLLDFQRHVAAVEEGVGLEVVLETAEIDIGRTYGG